MKKTQSKFEVRQQTHEEVEESQASRAAEAVREFASPEELLRFDAQQVEVPPAVEERLAGSIRQEDAPPESGPGGWWRKVFL